MDSLHENHTNELMELPKGKRALRNKWVYKLKPGDDGCHEYIDIMASPGLEPKTL